VRRVASQGPAQTLKEKAMSMAETHDCSQTQMWLALTPVSALYPGLATAEKRHVAYLRRNRAAAIDRPPQLPQRSFSERCIIPIFRRAPDWWRGG
jgi:hypothetical protein